VLGAFDLVVLGIGGVIGAGVFVLTGVAARQFAGPAVVLSYLIAAFASFLAALCYTEFAVELPVAGSAYNYVAVVYGELPAFLVGCDLVLEFTISAAAVARGWTSYAATMMGMDSEALRFGPSGLRIDLLATALVLGQSALLSWGIKESSNFNIVVNAVNLACIAFVLLVGGTKVETANWHPFAPNGISGVFAASSIVFFSFVGFDTVATAAEEVRNPSRDLPLGIIGSLVICTALYAGMCLVITGMVPSDDIDMEAPFAEAFARRGMEWAAGIVSAGALTGITTSLLVSLLGQPRIYMTMSRDGLLPAFFGRIHPTRGTPVNATMFTGLTAGVMAMLVNIDALAQLVSIGTLCVFCFVCSAVLGRRYTSQTEDSPALRRPILHRIAGMAASGLLLALTTELLGKVPKAVFFLLAIPLAALFCACVYSLSRFPQLTQPKKFAVPLVPYVPALGMYSTLQLIASLGPIAWLRFVVYYTVCTLAYCYYRGGVDPQLADEAAAMIAAGGDVSASGHDSTPPANGGSERAADQEGGAGTGIELTGLLSDDKRARGASIDDEGVALSAAERRAAERRIAKQGLLSGDENG